MATAGSPPVRASVQCIGEECVDLSQLVENNQSCPDSHRQNRLPRQRVSTSMPGFIRLASRPSTRDVTMTILYLGRPANDGLHDQPRPTNAARGKPDAGRRELRYPLPTRNGYPSGHITSGRGHKTPLGNTAGLAKESNRRPLACACAWPAQHLLLWLES